MSCPSDSQLESFLDGTLEPGSTAQIASHIDECQKCQARLDDIITLAATDGFDVQSVHPTADLDLADETAIADLIRRIQSAVSPSVEPYDGDSSSRPFSAAAIHENDLPVSLDHYQLMEKIGEGATGELYKAIDERLNREVAVKVLKPELAAIPNARARFEREARACAALRHDHIIAVHHVEARVPNQCPYLVMDFVNGGAFEEHIEPTVDSEMRTNVEWLRQAASALQAAHESGIVHRDIKPSNLLIDQSSGRLLVVDFGLAQLADAEESLTAEDAIAGTPAYMSPEQITNPDGVSGLSDIYSLGVVLYEAMTGERPFRGTVRMVLNQVQVEEPVPPRRLNDRIPRDLETICLKAMSKEPRLRYQSAAAFADDLQRWLDGRSVLARPISSIGKLWRWTRRNPRTAGASAIVLGVLIAGAIDWGRYQRDSTTDRLRREWQTDVSRRDELIAQNVTRAERAEQRWLQSIQLLALTISNRQNESGDTKNLISSEAQTLLRALTEDLFQHQSESAVTIIGAQVLGEIWSQLGDDDLAYRSYQIAAKDAVDLRGKGLDYLAELQILIRSHLRLGEIDLADGRLEFARRAFQIALQASEAFGQETKTASPVATSVILRLLGETAEQQADLDSARDYYVQAVAKLKLPNDPKDTSERIEPEAVLTVWRYAGLLNKLDDPQAHSACVKLCGLCRRQADQSLSGQRRLAAAYGELVTCLERNSHSQNEIMAALQQQAEVFEQITGSSEAESSDRRNCGEAWLRLATRHAQEQAWPQAEAAAQSSITVLTIMVEESEASTADRLNLVEAELLVATIQLQNDSVSAIERVKEMARQLNDISLPTAEEVEELKPRKTLLMQQCQRLIETASVGR